MSKEVFDQIKEGLTEALAIARKEAERRKPQVRPASDPEERHSGTKKVAP